MQLVAFNSYFVKIISAKLLGSASLLGSAIWSAWSAYRCVDGWVRRGFKPSPLFHMLIASHASHLKTKKSCNGSFHLTSNESKCKQIQPAVANKVHSLTKLRA